MRYALHNNNPKESPMTASSQLLTREHVTAKRELLTAAAALRASLGRVDLDEADDDNSPFLNVLRRLHALATACPKVDAAGRTRRWEIQTTINMANQALAAADTWYGTPPPQGGYEDAAAQFAWEEAEAARGPLAGAPDTMPCYECGGFDGVTAPEREVVALGPVVNAADPTSTYKLACGHTAMA